MHRGSTTHRNRGKKRRTRVPHALRELGVTPPSLRQINQIAKDAGRSQHERRTRTAGKGTKPPRRINITNIGIDQNSKIE
jgi:hypothetical protein